MCECFKFDLAQKYLEEKKKGIGGGYGEFGILNEDEFNHCLKTDGKSLEKFSEYPKMYARDHITTYARK